jgi:hypothetical protein
MCLTPQLKILEDERINDMDIELAKNFCEQNEVELPSSNKRDLSGLAAEMK